MTGQGLGRAESDAGSVSVEVRSVNQRGLKISPRLSDSLAPLEPKLDQHIRSQVQRGTLHINATFIPSGVVVAGEINVPVLTAYARQLRQVQESIGGDFSIELTGLLTLPGAVAIGSVRTLEAETLWPMLVTATDKAIAAMDAMRLAEGDAMATQLFVEIELIAGKLREIAELAPRVVDHYRQRLEAKILRVMEDRGLEFSPSDLIRDVQVYADRSDISEEITRLTSHLNLFGETLRGREASGRKLEFIIQEMFREANTIGSKASDSDISTRVVDIKCSIERVRELVQNIQ